MRKFLFFIGGTTVTLTILASVCVAQGQGGGGNQGGGNQGGGNQGGNNQAPGGILISPDGIVSGATASSRPARLEQRRLQALAAHDLPSDMNQASELRMVSLVKLDAECERALAAGEELSPAVRALGGLTRIEYVFVVPETSDLVIAGPAEGFAALENGRVVGTTTGRPTLTLDDLLVMLRLDSTGKTLGCSFDPEQSRLAEAKQWWQRVDTGATSAAVARKKVVDFAQVLGHWDVSIFGVPRSSHAAAAIVEADYRLKRLTLGLDAPGVRGFRSYFAMARPGGNVMRRWWFAPRYDVLETSPDETTFRMTGPRLQLLTQDEVVAADGQRQDAAFVEITNDKFTKQFNAKIEDLCGRVAALAMLQNQFDLAVTAALLRNYQMTQRIGWKPGVLLDEDRLPLAEYNVAQRVPSLVNVRPAGRTMLVGVVGGGVSIVPDQVVRREQLQVRQDLEAPSAASESNAWWWD